MANHYLSWNVSNRLNLGFFESVVWTDTNNRGFDMYFVNPIIFYRAVEFAVFGKNWKCTFGLDLQIQMEQSSESLRTISDR